ncbi:hypothetical protein PVNG_01226 [Plasmodium vivax North Korean]|uniref:ubiquitinyl hydrolase 1 n=1 Tax=Plasmodium vivax North Korean TaxID=1035514 RepID=A0A0J9TQ97_PLAVI|nr:hypothetical protein PVNG_01226 [Plasmodium vivax North Korean]
MIPPYGKIHVSLSNEYVEFYEEKSLKEPNNCKGKENDLKLSCEEEESTTVGCTRDDVFVDGHTGEKTFRETNQQSGCHHAGLGKYHLGGGKGGDASPELTSAGVSSSETEKRTPQVEVQTGLLVPPAQHGGTEPLRGVGGVASGDGVRDGARDGRASPGDGSPNQVNCKSRRATTPTVRLKSFKKIFNRTFSKYYFIGKPFKRYVKVIKSASQEKVKKRASKKGSTDGIATSKKGGAVACHGEEKCPDKRLDAASSESGKRRSDATMGGGAHAEGNIPPVKKCVHQMLLRPPKVRLTNRGNVVLSKMITKESISKGNVKRVKKVDKMKIAKKVEKVKKVKIIKGKGRPADMKTQSSVDEDAGQQIGQDKFHTRETSAVAIQRTKLLVHGEKCKSMGKPVVSGKDEVTNGRCSPRMEGDSMRGDTVESLKKEKKKKKKKKKKGTPEGYSTIGGGGYKFGEVSPGEAHLTGKRPMEDKPNGHAAMNVQTVPEKAHQEKFPSLQKAQRESGHHGKEGGRTAAPNGATLQNEEQRYNKGVREKGEREGVAIKPGGERKKKKRSGGASGNASGSVNPFGSGSGWGSEEGEAGRRGELNLSEYRILKEIKTKQSNEVVQLNLDSSFFVSKGAGLYNYGQNICFFNSIIQTIVRIPYICKDLLSKLHSLNCEKKKVRVFCFYCLFEQFACNIMSKKCGIKNMLIPYIKKYICNNYIVGYQEDVHEYLRYFLCSLEKSSFSSSIYIQKMFTGVTKNITICTKCNNVSLKYEQYYELSLDISSSNNLEEALRKYLSKETLMGDNGYYCDKCRKKKKATKQCVINKLPRVLTIQIKRFFMNSKYNVVKNHKHISYPLYLDMKGYVNSYDMFQNDFNNNVIALYEKVNPGTGGGSGQGGGQGGGQPSGQPSGLGNDRRSGVGSDQRSGPRTARPNPHVLNQIAHIFAELKREVCRRKIKNQLTPAELRSIIVETKKRIVKELNKIKFSKFYNDILLSISKDIDTLYCYMRANASRKHFSLKGALFNFKVEFLNGEEHPPPECEPCSGESGSRGEGSRLSDGSRLIDGHKFNDRSRLSDGTQFREKREHPPHSAKNHPNQRSASYFSYELTGLIKHIGSGTEYGHYVALTKSNNNIYLLCDDNNISYINKKEVLNCVKNAYVFIYTCIHPGFIDFYNKYVDVLEKKKFNINLPVFEKRVEFKERITMPKQKFISRSLHF